MRVYDSNLTGTAAAQTGAAPEIQRSDRGGARTPAAGGAGDRVELSTALGALSRALDTDRSDRAARVAALSAQYSRGEYRPDSAATSRAMLTESLSAAG